MALQKGEHQNAISVYIVGISQIVDFSTTMRCLDCAMVLILWILLGFNYILDFSLENMLFQFCWSVFKQNQNTLRTFLFSIKLVLCMVYEHIEVMKSNLYKKRTECSHCETRILVCKAMISYVYLLPFASHLFVCVVIQLIFQGIV